MGRRFLVTGALPYSNGRLHVGHIAGAYVPADIYVRYLRARGDDVRFICGSDDNGVAIPITAAKEGRTPEEVCADYSKRQVDAFEGLGIHFDVFGGTHNPEFFELHTKFSQDFFHRIHDKGLFTKKKTKQLFDAEANKFLPDRYIKGTCPFCKHDSAYGDQCEDCGKGIDPLTLIDPVSTITGTKPEIRDTVHWYLRLDHTQKELAAWLESHPEWRPTVLNFAKGLLKEGLPERAMTRDLSWGIPVPLDDPDAAGKVLYVWFDAPIGYVSFTAQYCEAHEGGSENYARWWKDPDCKIVHFIGEDNIIFHALIWPAMLMAEGTYQLPHNVVANSYLNIKFPGKEEEKISKSRGTAIWIEEYLKRFEPDPLRYYLTAVAPENQRTAFDVDDFINRNNTELLNALGNFVNRTLTFTQRYFEGNTPEAGAREAVDNEQIAAIEQARTKATENLEACRFKAALADVMDLARTANGYFDTKQPWKQRKDDLAACGTTINVCLQTVKGLTALMAPFLPFSADRCLKMLNLPKDALQWDAATEELPAGAPIAEPQILFQKLDPAELFEQ